MEKDNFESDKSVKEEVEITSTIENGNDFVQENKIEDETIVDDLQNSLSQNRKANNKTDKQEKENIIGKIKKNPKKILKIVVLFLIFFFSWFAIVQYIIADKYDVVVRVVEEGGKVGVNPMTERLDYGDLPKGNASTRFITIENTGSMDVNVIVMKYGKIAELIKISENNFTLNPGKKERLELLLEMPISANKKEYDGKVVIFKLPKLF